MKKKQTENKSINFEYPEINYTINDIFYIYLHL
jgi:hypothetical protein